MGRNSVGGLLLLALVVPATTASAASLTRKECWVARFADRSQRTVCFLASGRVTGTNASWTVDGSRSTCNFTGQYVQRGENITVIAPDGTGTCSNGARSMNYKADCKFSGETLSCNSSSVVRGKTYTTREAFR
jgi:hypothetical protein